MNRFNFIALLLCPVLLCSCATIISGRTQKFSVNTFPNDAKVTVNGAIQKSPCVVLLDRTTPTYQVVIEKEGFQTVTYNLQRGVNGWVLGNVLLGGIVGIVIDCSSGSVWAFNPDNISVNLVSVK